MPRSAYDREDGRRERHYERYRSRSRERSRHRRHRREDDDDYYSQRGGGGGGGEGGGSSSHGGHGGHRGDRDRDRDTAGTTGTSRRREEEEDVPPPPKKKKEEANEIDDLTKDQRTVFVSQLVIKASEKQLRSFFEKIGKVKDVIMIRDKYTNRHKGFAYVEMADLESVPMVLMLNGTLPDFQRFPILVKASEAEKNFLAKQEVSSSSGGAPFMEPAPKRKLAIGNLHPKITERDLRTVLAPFGEVDDVDLVGAGKAVVAFRNADDARKAFSKVAGIELGAGEPITVDWAFVEENGGGGQGGGQGGSSSDWRLDADDQGGMQLNPLSRAALMNQLGQRAGLTNADSAYAPHRVEQRETPGQQKNRGTPSAAFVISNMFDPAKETEPTWREDIAEDVKAECDKHGTCLHVHVDAVSSRGLVHVLFDSLDAARNAAESLDGRWFASRKIDVHYVDPKTHRLQFASEIPSS